MHPILCLAGRLRERGHSPVVATDLAFRERVEARGVAFAPLRPGLGDFSGDPEVFRRVNHPVFGAEYIVRTLVMPFLRQSVEDLERASEGADLLVSHPLTYSVPLVSEKRGIPWISTALQPMVLLSAYDPPVLAPLPWMERLRPLGPGFHRIFLAFAKASSRHWARPVDRLRRDLGLAPARGHPLFGGQYSPRLTLALFSRHLAAPQPDWPPGTVVTGFPFFDEPAPEAPLLERFLSSGEPPIVFTLGTTAVNDAGGFYRAASAAAERLGRRAVLLVGDDPRNREGLAESPDRLILPYVPFGHLFGRAAAIVHQGGVGTTAQALRSGRPQVVVPFANDQPDNAARVARLGVGLRLSRRAFSVETASRALASVLETPGLCARAQALGRLIREERGAEAAADAVETACADL